MLTPSKYGYPISVYTDYVAPILSAVGTNRLLRQTQPAPPSGTSNANPVYPDADALYSRAVVDLSSNNVLLTLPQVPAGEYYVISFYDLYELKSSVSLESRMRLTLA